MAATVQLVSLHGAAGATENVLADGATVQFKRADNDTNDGSAPVPVPAAGTNYSFVKQLRFRATVAPDNLISNLVMFTDGVGALGTGLSLLVRVSPTYVNPLTQGSDPLPDTANAFGYTAGAPLAIPGSLTAPATGFFGQYVQLQAGVGPTAGPGNSGEEILTFSFDES